MKWALVSHELDVLYDSIECDTYEQACRHFVTYLIEEEWEDATLFYVVNTSQVQPVLFKTSAALIAP